MFTTACLVGGSGPAHSVQLFHLPLSSWAWWEGSGLSPSQWALPTSFQTLFRTETGPRGSTSLGSQCNITEVHTQIPWARARDRWGSQFLKAPCNSSVPILSPSGGRLVREPADPLSCRHQHFIGKTASVCGSLRVPGQYLGSKQPQRSQEAHVVSESLWGCGHVRQVLLAILGPAERCPKSV